MRAGSPLMSPRSMRAEASRPCTLPMTPCSLRMERCTLLSFRHGQRWMPCWRQMRLSVVGHTPILEAASFRLNWKCFCGVKTRQGDIEGRGGVNKTKRRPNKNVFLRGSHNTAGG